MIVHLDVPFADTGVAGLAYLPDAPALPVLAALDQRDLVPDGHLSLRLLGASHQAVLALPEGRYAETLACLGGATDPLPTATAARVGRWRCRLRIEVGRVDPPALESTCRRLRRIAAAEDPRRSLYASFPGHPLAATFLRVHPGGRAGRPGPAWTTVHVYPESGEVVRTRTEIRPVRVETVDPGRAATRPRPLRELV